MSTRAPGALPATVVVAIFADRADGLRSTVAAVRSQVYEIDRVAVIGGERRVRDEAAAEEIDWVANLSSFVSGLDRNVTHVWLVHAGARPRPDALRALIRDAERSGASLAGSKLLSADNPDVLLSVGLATDVFDATYIGLDPDEVDQGQYDVVRDVAAVPGASLLVRRDLLAGVGGVDPKLAPEAAAIDLCQRARLRGARIVVSPASEVLYPPEPIRSKEWREDAGRIRAMLKVYGVLTLVWALPLLFIVGLIEAIVSPVLGRWKLFDWLRAWGWNLVSLPSTLTARRAARKGRVAGDAEIFRFQVRGSSQLRAMISEIGGKLQARLPGDYSSVAELGRELRRPAFLVGAAAVAFVALATRTIWREGVPSHRFSLPLPASGSDAVAAYAGGWNPGGFGGVDPLPPFVGFSGVLQVALFNRPGLTMAVIVVAACLLGVWGTTRLVRTWDVSAVPGIVAGVVLVAGPATRSIGDSGSIPTLAALGILPWAMRLAVTRLPRRWPARLGRLAAIAWLTGLVGILQPSLLVLPALAAVVWALLNLTERRAWVAALLSVVGAGIAVWVLMPWVTFADLEAYFGGGEAFWEPNTVVAVLLLLVVVTVAAAAPGKLGLLAGWGAVIVGAGALAARSADFGGGRHVELAGLAAVALGSAIVVAVGLEIVTAWWSVKKPVRPLAGLAVAVSSFLVVMSLGVLISGRSWLPPDDLGEALEFVGVSDAAAHQSRVLLLGSADALPGESHAHRGLNYRVASLPAPEMWEAWLPERGVADLEFEAVLDTLLDGETSRVGREFARFGIRWVMVMDETPLEPLFEGQLDLVPLRGLDRLSYTVDAETPVRAVTAGGTVWTPDGTAYVGPTAVDDRVFLADNANNRWGPEWQQVSFGNEVSARTGTAEFRRYATRVNQATMSASLFLGLLFTSWIGRRFR